MIVTMAEGIQHLDETKGIVNERFADTIKGDLL